MATVVIEMHILNVILKGFDNGNDIRIQISHIAGQYKFYKIM